MLKRHLYSILFFLWLGGVTFASLFSFSNQTESKIWFPHLDKIIHFSFYFGVVFFGFLACREYLPAFKTKKIVYRLIVFAICYGLLIEFLQYLMPFNRSAEIWDAVANSSGAIIAGLLIVKYGSLIPQLK